MVHATISCNTALQHSSNQIRNKLKPDGNCSLFLSGTLYFQVSKKLAIWQRETGGGLWRHQISDTHMWSRCLGSCCCQCNSGHTVPGLKAQLFRLPWNKDPHSSWLELSYLLCKTHAVNLLKGMKVTAWILKTKWSNPFNKWEQLWYCKRWMMMAPFKIIQFYMDIKIAHWWNKWKHTLTEGHIA